MEDIRHPPVEVAVVNIHYQTFKGVLYIRAVDF